LLSLYKGGPEAVLHEIAVFLTARLGFRGGSEPKTKSRHAAKRDG
jgi:hypothetical protein